MKQLLAVILGSVIFAALAITTLAQGNPRGKDRLMLNGKAITVEYGRPALKGRTAEQMLGRLKPGDVWRLGADQSTTFSTATDLTFGDVKIPEGQYSLWVRREGDDSWKLVFNKQHGQWGTEHDASQDLAAVPLKVEKGERPAEQVTINLEKEQDGGEIAIHWGDMELSTYFKAV